jgi:hypothetical protein
VRILRNNTGDDNEPFGAPTRSGGRRSCSLRYRSSGRGYRGPRHTDGRTRRGERENLKLSKITSRHNASPLRKLERRTGELVGYRHRNLRASGGEIWREKTFEEEGGRSPRLASDTSSIQSHMFQPEKLTCHSFVYGARRR